MEKQVFVGKSSVFVIFWCLVLLMFSERLKNLRLRMGEKQSDVADGVGITRASLSTYACFGVSHLPQFRHFSPPLSFGVRVFHASTAFSIYGLNLSVSAFALSLPP